MTLTDEEIRVKKLEDDKINRRVEELLGRHAYLGVLYPGSRCTTCGEFIEQGEHYVLHPRDFLNDKNAAFQLCDRMHSEGWSYTITRYPERTEHFVTFGKPEHEGFHASDPSLARAVTLCFLAAHSNEN